MKDNPYSLRIHWSDEDEAFIATCAEFPHLSGYGDAKGEAIAMLDEAIAMALESCERDNLVPPAPVKLPAYSGNLRLRMPSSLHRAIAERAEEDGVSLNTYILSRLASETTHHVHEHRHEVRHRHEASPVVTSSAMGKQELPAFLYQYPQEEALHGHQNEFSSRHVAGIYTHFATGKGAGLHSLS